MPKRTQLRGGSTASHALFTGASRELTIDTDKKVAVVHDGTTAGGFPLARADQALAAANNLSDLADEAEARESIDVFSKSEVHTLNRTRQRSNGLSFDSVTANQRIYCALGNLAGQGESIYDIGTNPFSLRMIFKVPDTTGVTRTLAMISTSSSAIAADGFAVVLGSGILGIRKYGLTTSDYSSVSFADMVDYVGEVVELLIVRTTSGILAYVNGTAVGLLGPSSYGAGASMTGEIASSSYLVFGYGIGSKFVGQLYGLTIFNYALSAAEASALAIHGIDSSDTWANDNHLITNPNNRTFGGAVNWANVDLWSYDASGDLTISASAVGQKANLPSANMGTFATGRKYQINFTTANTSGTFHFKGSSGGLTFGTFNSNGNQHQTGTLEATSFGNLEVVTSVTGAADIDDIVLKQAGAILDLDFLQGGEYQVMDRSSNRKHATMVASPVFLYPRRYGQVRFRCESALNTQFLGGTCIPVNARIMAIVAYPSEDTPTIFLGTSSGASDLVASVGPLTAGARANLTLAAFFSTTGNIWVKSDSSGRIDFTVIYELVD